MPLLPFQNSQPPEPEVEYVVGYCVVGMDTVLSGSEDQWPEKFVVVPREGDFVRSAEGATLKVLQVTHLIREGPIFEVLLGKDVTTQSEVGF